MIWLLATVLYLGVGFQLHCMNLALARRDPQSVSARLYGRLGIKSRLALYVLGTLLWLPLGIGQLLMAALAEMARRQQQA